MDCVVIICWQIAVVHQTGYLVGVAEGFFAQQTGSTPEWRLLIVTGFLSGRTIFSTFSVEVTALIQQRGMMWAGVAVSDCVVGSLAMTLLDSASVTLFQRK